MILEADDVSYVPLLRKIKTSEIIRSGPLCQVFVWLLTDAAYYDRTVQVPVQYGMKRVELRLGESFVNTRELGTHLNLKPPTIRKCLRALVLRQTISCEPLYGGYKVRLLNAERYWQRWQETEQEHEGAFSDVVPDRFPMLDTNATQSGPSNIRSSEGGPDNAFPDVAPDCFPMSVTPRPEVPISQGLGAPLRSIEQQQLQVELQKISEEEKDSQSVVLRGAQLDLIAPTSEPPADDAWVRDEEALVAFFVGKPESKWNAVQDNLRWIRAMLLAHHDVTWILSEFAHYYTWWQENPKKRRENLEASIGNWLRKEARILKRTRKAGSLGYVQAPTEPGKYDGIGVTARTD